MAPSLATAVKASAFHFTNQSSTKVIPNRDSSVKESSFSKRFSAAASSSTTLFVSLQPSTCGFTTNSSSGSLHVPSCKNSSSLIPSSYSGPSPSALSTEINGRHFLFATSPVVRQTNTTDDKLILQRHGSGSGRALLSDRKGPWDHFKTRSLILSTVRVSMMQGSFILSNFFTDQLEAEQERDELVVQGKLTNEQAEKDNSEWEEREWSLRWKEFPTKTVHALIRFHSVTLLMRLYESICANTKYLALSPLTLDKLTKDTFKSAIRKRDRYSSTTSANGKGEGNQLGKDMFYTCLWANVISFLADFTIQQVVLIYGFYLYRMRKKMKKSLANSDETKNLCKDDQFIDSESEGMFLSFVLKSSKVLVSRSMGLVAASAGGAVGSMIYPGWGTLFGTQIGDSIALALLD